MAFMARRPPSVIALGDAELQAYLQSIFLRSLAVDVDNLRLNDLDDQSCSNDNSDHGGDSGESGDSASTSSNDEAITPTFYTSAGASSGTGTTTSLKETKGSISKLATPTPSILASGITKSAHQATDPGSPYTTSSKTLQSLPSLRPRGRYSLSLNIRPERVALIMTPQGCPQKGVSQRGREKGWSSKRMVIKSLGFLSLTFRSRRKPPTESPTCYAVTARCKITTFRRAEFTSVARGDSGHGHRQCPTPGPSLSVDEVLRGSPGRHDGLAIRCSGSNSGIWDYSARLGV